MLSGGDTLMRMLVMGCSCLAACSDKGDDSSPSGESDADTDADADTDTDADTDAVPLCKGTMNDTRDGHPYDVVALEGDCWLAENLDYGQFLDDAGAGPHMIDEKLPQKYCYGYEEANCATYGGLYEWAELMDYAPSDNKARGTTQGLCPPDWHLPTDEEWKSFEYALGMDIDEVSEDGWRGTAIGATLLMGGITGFDAVLAGYRNASTGATELQGQTGLFWTSTTDEADFAWFRQLADPTKKSEIGRSTADVEQGFSARCVRDLPLTDEEMSAKK
jgi:uncharacterized protein (TIGR02145 family)